MTGRPQTRPGSPAINTVCVVGSGGREHALAVVLGRTADVVVTPGNPGIAGGTAEGHTITSTHMHEPPPGLTPRRRAAVAMHTIQW